MSKNATFNPTYLTLVHNEKDITVFRRVVMSLGCLSFVLNATFLVALARNRDLVKRKRITYHVANLAMADTMFGLSLFCDEIVQFDYIVFDVVSNAAVRASFSAILLMNIERAVVITKPCTWKDILTIKRILLAILSIWITVLSLAVIQYYYFWSLSFQFFNVLVFLFICLLVVFVYIYIAWRLLVEGRRSAAISHNQEAARRLYNKACALSVLLAIVMVVTCGPNLVLNAIVNRCRFSNWNCVIRTPFILYIYWSLFIFELLNFIINPVLYIWRVGTYRKAFRRMFKTNVNVCN